jgi:hypothetical protein
MRDSHHSNKVPMKWVALVCICNISVDISARNGLPALMMNGVFWDVTPCGSCENRRFRGT